MPVASNSHFNSHLFFKKKYCDIHTSIMYAASGDWREGNGASVLPTPRQKEERETEAASGNCARLKWAFSQLSSPEMVRTRGIPVPPTLEFMQSLKKGSGEPFRLESQEPPKRGHSILHLRWHAQPPPDLGL